MTLGRAPRQLQDGAWSPERPGLNEKFEVSVLPLNSMLVLGAERCSHGDAARVALPKGAWKLSVPHPLSYLAHVCLLSGSS